MRVSSHCLEQFRRRVDPNATEKTIKAAAHRAKALGLVFVAQAFGKACKVNHRDAQLVTVKYAKGTDAVSVYQEHYRNGTDHDDCCYRDTFAVYCAEYC